MTSRYVHNLVPVTLFAVVLVSCESRGPANSRRGVVSLQDSQHAEANGSDLSQKAMASSTNPNSAAMDDEFEGSEALPPQVVAGAALACLMTPERDVVACQVENSSKKAVGLPRTLLMEWQLTNPVSREARVISNAVEVVDVPGYETTFFVKVPDAKGMDLHLKASDSKNSVDLAFPLENLESKPRPEIQASVSIDNDLESFMAGMTGFATGDDGIGLEKEGCGSPSQLPGNVSTRTMTFEVPEKTVGVSIYLKNVCGLQTSRATLTIEGPPPFQPIITRLTPATKDITIAKDVNMLAGSYKATLRNDEKQLDGSLDNFSFQELSFARK